MYPPMNQEAQRFYDNKPTTLRVCSSENGEPTKVKKLHIARQFPVMGDELPTDLKDELANNLENLYGSVEAYKTNIDGQDYQFEIGVIEGDEPTDTELRVSTFSSSMTGNYGNGFEIARLAAYNPNRSYVYVASPGNGMSSRLTIKEMRYFSRHGRLLYEDTRHHEPLPIVKALGKVLLQQGITPTRLGSDSAGAVLTTAFGAVYGKGNIEASHQNVRTGIRDISPIALIKGMRIEDVKTSKAQSASSRDALRMRPEILDFTAQHVKREFPTHISPLMLVANILGLGRGPAHGDPLVADNRALVRHNEGVKILFTAGRDDPLTQNVNLNTRMIQLVREITADGTGTANAVMLEHMSHGIQTHYPQFLQALGRAVLG